MNYYSLFICLMAFLLAGCEKEYESPRIPRPDPFGIPMYLYSITSDYAPTINCSAYSIGDTLLIKRNMPVFDMTSVMEVKNKVSDSIALLIGKNIYYAYWNFNYYTDRMGLPTTHLKHYDETNNPDIQKVLGNLLFYVSCNYFNETDSSMTKVRILYNVKKDPLFRTIH